MARQQINIGQYGNDATGDSIRESFRKVNENFSELYGALGLGDLIQFTKLYDTPDTYSGQANKIVAVEPATLLPNGSVQQPEALVFKEIRGKQDSGIVVENTIDAIVIDNTANSLAKDTDPMLGGNLNVKNGEQQFTIINMPDYPLSQGEAVSKTYTDTKLSRAGSNAVDVSVIFTGSFSQGTNEITSISVRNLTAGMSVIGVDSEGNSVGIPAGTTITSIIDLESLGKITISNPVTSDGTNVRILAGDVNAALGTMSGPLLLSRNPVLDLEAATKQYVDTSSYYSRVNFYVSTNGDDERTDIPVDRRGRALAYSFASVGKACREAEKLLETAPFSLGPYQKKLTYAASTENCLITSITPNIGVNGSTQILVSTNGLRTDYELEIREGYLLRGDSSGAIGKIAFHSVSSALVDGDEVIDIEILDGTFVNGESLTFGEPIQDLNITIFIESGTYFEHFPLRMPPNVTVKGDETRRVIIKPKPGVSESPWVRSYFRRDKSFDEITLGIQEYGCHYLTDPNDINSTPKNNNELDIFLANDGNIIRNITCQGHGGFFAVLDPTGQILTKSPYHHLSSSISESMNVRRFAGGQFIDGSASNLLCNVEEKIDDYTLKVYEVQREPQLPCSFFIEGIGYRVNTISKPGLGYDDAIFLISSNKNFIRAEIIGYIAETFGDNFDYDSALCSRDVGYMIDALVYDLTYGGNSKSVASAMSYYLNNVSKVIGSGVGNQKAATLQSLTYLKSLTLLCANNTAPTNVYQTVVSQTIDVLYPDGSLAATVINSNLSTIISIVDTGSFPTILTKNRDAADPTHALAIELLGNNREFIIAETIGYIEDTFTVAYDQELCARDIGLMVDAVENDLTNGGNLNAIQSGISYYLANVDKVIGSGTGNQKTETIASIEFVRDLALTVVLNEAPDQSYQTAPLVNQYTVAPLSEAQIETIVDASVKISLDFNTIRNIVRDGYVQYPSYILSLDESTPFLEQTADYSDAITLLNANRQFISEQVVEFVTDTYPALVYNQTLCERDAGLIVDALANDLERGGNVQSLYAAASYYRYNVQTVIGTDPASQRVAELAAIEYLKTLALDVIVNQTPATVYPGTVAQVKNLSLTDGALANVELTTNADLIIDTIDSGYPAADGLSIELVTAGNRSMLSNDFTQINDLAYGIVATNGGIAESVSVFTYYCRTGFYSLNGGQIRSLNGSCAYGEIALKAEGSDPYEAEYPVSLSQNLVQGAQVYAPVGYVNEEGGTSIWIDNYTYVPYNSCELEVVHTGSPDVIVRYFIASVSTQGLPTGVAKLNISTSGNNDTSTGGLYAAVPDNTKVVVRSLQSIQVTGAGNVLPSRPSTAIDFYDNVDTIYRVLGFSVAGLPVGTALLTLRENYRYVQLTIFDTQPALHGNVSNTKIAIVELGQGEIDRILPDDSSQNYKFGWRGTVYTINGYTPPVTPGDYASLSFSPALVDSVDDPDFVGFALRAGNAANAGANISVKVSTMRATGHDMLEIGTGSFADTNFPSVIYGEPLNPPNSALEVKEINKGRVFFVSTDQDGNFKVGEYFKVDQGSGTVTFSASIALSNLDGLGFRRGVTVSEFSIDDTMTDIAVDTVPTEAAVVGYMNRRLGHTGSAQIIGTAGRIGPGFLPLNGSSALEGNVDAGSNRIVSLANPVGNGDAVNLGYMKLENLQDKSLSGIATGDFLMLTGTNATFTNALTDATGDISTTLNTGTRQVKFTIDNSVITNAMVSSSAAIDQSKLNLSNSTAASTSGGATKGISSFNSANFGATSGYISLASNGVALSNLAKVSSHNVIGNKTGALGDGLTADPTNITFVDVATLGGSVMKSDFTTLGVLTVTSTSPTKTFGITTVDTTKTNNTIVRRGASGEFAAGAITVDSLNILNSANTGNSKTIDRTQDGSAPSTTGSLNIYGYDQTLAIKLNSGPSSANKKSYYYNEEHLFRNASGTTGSSITAADVSASNFYASTNIQINNSDVITARHINAQLVMSGGGLVTWTGSSLLWGTRIIVVPVEKTELSTVGYLDITCPTSGTVTYYNAAGAETTVTCTASGIPLASWEALYYEISDGQGSASDQTKFRVVNYQNPSWRPNRNWLLIAAVNGDGDNIGHVKWIPGQVNIPTTGSTVTYNSGSGQSSWAGSSVTDETTNATRYITFSGITSGPLTTTYVSSSKLKFNPSSGVFESPRIKGQLQGYTETVSTATVSTTTYNLDLSTANIFNITLSNNVTFTFTNPPTSGNAVGATVILKQDGAGNRAASFTNAKYTDGAAPTLTTTANRYDVMSFFSVDGGTIYFGSLALANVF